MRRQNDKNREIDNVYLNISFQPTYDDNEAVVLEYNTTKDTPILEKMSDYYMSVIRFDIPLAEVPITIFPIKPNQPNPNLSSLIIGINYNNVSYPINLIYEPQYDVAVFGGVPVQNEDKQVVNEYYYIYQYENMILLINKALKTSYINSGLQALFPSYEIPKFVFNSTSQLITLIVPKFFITLTAPAVSIPTINMNYNFYQYLDGFPFFEIDNNSPIGFDARFVLSDGAVTNSDGYAIFGTLPTNPPEYYEVKQSTSILQFWNPIKKILLTSDTIPVLKEYIQGTGKNSQTGNPSLPIVTDFTPIVEKAGDGRSIAYYLPTSEYRKVDLISDLALTKISMRVYWEDIYGNINPLYIGSYQQASVKIVFLNKSMYKNN
jgi:hypothetical protein